MKKILALVLCAALLLASATTASALNFGWWRDEPQVTPTPMVRHIERTATPTPAPKASACSLCDGTGYTALKTGAGEYVAVPCPQCSGSSTPTNTASPVNNTSQFEETVQSFIDYLKMRFADHDVDFVYTVRNTEEDKWGSRTVQIVTYKSKGGHYELEFWSEDDVAVKNIIIKCDTPEEINTIVLTALIIIEACYPMDDDTIDWFWDTADKLVTTTKRGELNYTIDVGESNILFNRTYEVYDKTAYDYCITFR